MMKMSKQLSKIAFSLAILLASFEGEGYAQVVIEQQCAINCNNTFNTNFNTCTAQNPPSTCLSTAITALKTCIAASYVAPTSDNPNPCPSNSTSPAMTTPILQSCANSCFDAFNICGASPGLTCVAGAMTLLSTCLTGIKNNSNCLPQ